MNKNRIVIIGSTGHLGFNITKRLLNTQKEILLLVRKKKYLYRGTDKYWCKG